MKIVQYTCADEKIKLKNIYYFSITIYKNICTKLMFSLIYLVVYINHMSMNSGGLMISSPISKILVILIQLCRCYIKSWMDWRHHNLLVVCVSFPKQFTLKTHQTSNQ